MSNLPIVILHGWNLDSAKYQNLSSELKDKYSGVYCPDLPGFGKAEIEADSWNLTDYAEFVKKYLHKHHLANPILIGHSFGGRIAIRFASLYPKAVKAIVLSGTPGVSLPGINTRINKYIAKTGLFILRLIRLQRQENKIRDFYYSLIRSSDYRKTTEELKQTFKNIIQDDLRRDMAKISTPTLLVWGALDQIVPLPIAKKMRSYLPFCELVIFPRAKHGLPWTHSKEFAWEINKLIKKL